MTANLQLFQKFRDIQVAEDVGKKAELGWFDVEFTMYGCAYLNLTDSKMYYKVSSRAEDIYTFIEDCAKDDIFPSAVEHLTLKCPVPMGTRELIAQDVKKELAKQLKKQYSKEFFVQLYQIAQEIQNNLAFDILQQESERIEGLFEEEKLKRFEDLVNYSYSCRKLTNESYRNFLAWINEERKSMDDSLISKDVFEKTMYGLAYEDNGKIKYAANAQKDYIYRLAYEKEQQGEFIDPIYERTYWYNYTYRLADVIRDFKEEIKNVCNADYVAKIKNLRGAADAQIKEKYEVVLNDLREKYGDNAYRTAQRYFSHWNLM